MGKADYVTERKAEYGLKKRIETIGRFRVSKEEQDMFFEVVKELEKRNIKTQAEAIVWCIQLAHHKLDVVKMNKMFNRNRSKKL